MKKLSIITVGMNHLKYLQVFYDSLYNKNTPVTEFEAIYVDNCSSDGSVDYISSHYPQVKIVENTEVLGFGENNNKGFAVSTGDIIGIVNPDIEILENSLDLIAQYIESEEKDCIVAPQLLNPDRSIQYSVRRFVTLKSFLMRLRTGANDDNNSKGVKEYLCKTIDTSAVQPVDWALGAALFMRRGAYLALGGFDQRYFLYMEDEDLCLRGWKNGIPTIYYPLAKLIHNHLRGSAKLGKKTIYHFVSVVKFFCRHGIHVQRNSYNS